MREALNEEFYVTVSDGTVEDPYTGEIVKNNLYNWGVEVSKEYIGQTFGYYDFIKMLYPKFDLAAYPNFSDPATAFEPEKIVPTFASFYIPKNPDDPNLADRTREEMYVAYPITKKMAVYVLDPQITARELAKVENWIKTYAVSYTYEELDYDHELTEYVGTEKAPPFFKMALEYTIDENGMSVRLPANGIRYDESLYQLENIEMLPYMGAGMNDKDFADGGDGYTFFPDGSGAIFDFESLNTGSNKTITSKVYGQDYAYHKITGTYQETIRYPAFGIVENYTGKKTVNNYDMPMTDKDGNVLYDKYGNIIYATEVVDVKEQKGFLAIIEEGDAMAELSSVHESATTVFNTVKMIYYPRPKDSYNMADAISVGSNTVMTVLSERKYVGNYTVRYIMLTDDGLAKENQLASYYECSWMGMAVAYRDYLESTEVLTRLKDTELDNDIPLYVETFGTMMTTEKFLSIPMDVMTPLTTFEDINTMYTELSTSIEAAMKDVANGDDAISITNESAANFSNINFKLTGFANGGMYATVPYHLNWESAVGGASGFEELVEIAKREGFGVFPDFDFAYIHQTDIFDGVSLDKHAVKTIDNRYTSRREYSATYQTYVGYFDLAISPSCFERFITKLSKNYLKYNPIGISVGSLGTDLNSNFNEDDPLNREDSKAYTIEALEILSGLKNDDGKNLEIMTAGGNAYTWKYVDYIINMPLNSSRYKDASNAVPFIGVVLHGYVQFAGTPINEEGDIEMAMLKAIENGASIYFTFAYQNTEKLKEDMLLNKYFSVRYDIWKNDLVSMYVELNNLLGDLQTKLIIDHDFLVGERVPDEDEIIADEEAKAEAERLEQLIKDTEAAKQALKDALENRHVPANSVDSITEMIADAEEYFQIVTTYAGKFNFANVSDITDTTEYSKYLNEINSACDKLATYRDDISKAVDAAEKATQKIYDMWLDYQAKAAQAEIDVLVYRTAFFAAKYDAEELAELSAELAADAEATELDKKACANAIAMSGKTVDELKAAVDAATGADKAEAEILLNAATVVADNEADAKLIDAEYQKVAANKVTYDKKVVSYSQFYTTACEETASAKALKDSFEAKYAVSEEESNSQKILEFKVFVLGGDKFDAAEDTLESKLPVFNTNTYIADSAKNVEDIKALLVDLDAKILEYKAAKKAYDDYAATDISGMTEAELDAYKAECETLLKAVTDLEAEVKAIDAQLKTVIGNFRFNYGFANMDYNSCKNALDVLNAELDLAKKLLSKNPSDANVQNVIDDYESRIAAFAADFNAVKTPFDAVCNDAFAMGLLIKGEDGSYTLNSKDIHEDTVKDAFAKAPTTNDKYVTTKYTCDDGSIVAVTYGGKDGDDNKAYRTFILNYNAFAVTVKYGDVEYKLGAYEYAVINH